MFKTMIVDDVEFMRKEIRRLKIWGEPSGFIISSEAVNGQDALKKLEGNPVDLIITDIRMPVIDGLELLQRVKERRLASCVVLLSEHCEFSYAKQGIVHGAFDYLSKPVDEDELIILLQRVRQFIFERLQGDERLKQLEEKVAERVEVFFPADHVKRIVELIKAHDERAVEAAYDMVESTHIALERDVIKTAVVINKAVSEIISAVSAFYPWLGKFANIDLIINNNISKINDVELVKITAAKIMDKIVNIVNSLLPGSQDNELVKRTCHYVLENIDLHISLAAIAENLYVNKTHLSETFKQKSGISLIEYMTMVKLERAKMLIQNKGLKIYEISQRLGYDDNSYFTNIFKKYTGLTPTEFKQTKF